jgi:serine-type D-Ala-D-Ala carboxypeptidase (penicillin-binding protein 5/6)
MHFFSNLVLCLVLVFQSLVCNAAEIKKDVDIHNMGFQTNAEYAYLLDYDTNTALFAKNATEMVTPSSMSKLMTIYIVFQHLKNGYIKLNDKFYISEKAWKMGGSRMFLEVNSKVTVSELLKGIIVQSGNDASVALAEGIASNEDIFVYYMNEAAKKLGLKNSHFANSSGWPHPEHKMSAEDLGILAATIIREFPEFYEMFSEKSFTYNKIYQPNRNILLGTLGVDGLKTGNTEEVGYGIVISAKQNGIRLIAVVNGLKSMKERAMEAERLLLYGFNNFVRKEFIKANDILAQIPVKNAKTVTVGAITKNDIDLMLPKTISQELIQNHIEYNDTLTAPIARGQEIATLFIKNNGIIMKQVPLYAVSSLEEAGIIQKLWQTIKEWCGY